MKKVTVFTFILILSTLWGCSPNEQPPAPGIVATFEGGQLTGKEVRDYLGKLLEGAEADDVQKIQRKEVYKGIIKNMVLDKMVKARILEKKFDKKENVKHVMKHISEEMNINELHSKAHKGRIKVTQTDIRKYYEDNRKQFGSQPLAEVTDEIRPLIESEKEEAYFENYLSKLRKNAAITREDRLLNVPTPTDIDIRIYYETNRLKYSSSGKSPSELKDQFKVILRGEMKKNWFEKNRDRTLFTIHGKRFTVGEFYQELKELSPQENKKYQSFEGMKELLSRLIDRMLIVEDTFDQMLNTENQEEIQHIREDILRQLLHQEEVDDKLDITEKEVKSFFEKNKKRFLTAPRVKISYIRIKHGLAEDEQKRAQKKVEEAYRKLKPGLWEKGASFETVARQYSEDPETAQNGGELDRWFTESNNIFEEIAFHEFHENILNLATKEISAPFQSRGSYYIVKVREREESRPMAFEEVREHLKTELSARKHEELMRQMEESLLSRANLVVYEDEVEAMFKKK